MIFQAIPPSYICCGLQLKFLWLAACQVDDIINSLLPLWGKVPHMMHVGVCSFSKHSFVHSVLRLFHRE